MLSRSSDRLPRPSIADTGRRLSFASFRMSDIESLPDQNGGKGGKDEECSAEQSQSSQSQDDTEILARAETKRLRRWKLSMLLVFTLIGMGASYAAFYVTRQNHAKTQNQQSTDLANQIADGYLASTRALIWATYTTSVSYTSSFQASVWPFVTLPNFSLRTIGSLASSKSLSLAFAPRLDSDEARKNWEEYAVLAQAVLATQEQSVVLAEIESNRITLEEGALDTTLPNTFAVSELTQRRSSTNRTIEQGIYRIVLGEVVDDDGQSPFYPIWQISPKQTQALVSTMYNQASQWNRRVTIQKMLDSKRATFTDVLIQDVDYNPSDGIVPRSLLFFPVLKDFTDKGIGGSMTLELDWQDVLSNILPEQSDQHPMMVILENSCQQTFSFQINGHVATFLGEGDQHDVRFDSQVVSTTYEQFGKLTSIGSVITNGAASAEGCLYQIRIYPSVALDQNYEWDNPFIFPLFVASIFLFAILCFIVYDCRVELRQRRIMKSAGRTSAIVHQLFPRQVRERMLKRLEEQQQRPPSLDGMDQPVNGGRAPKRNSILTVPTIATPKLRLKNFLAHSPLDESIMNISAMSSSGMHDVYNNDMEGEPIADLFPHTTIMFADIAGFTAWSSEREPSQVFKLLESLYKSFDGVARKLGVFKVETIGDCYVAVTGLPDPNKDHAVVMARFAFECLYHMHELTRSLENALGPGTTDLALRVGLHSGPVTAGVLRGEKSRFQLFGDTMNTAARMESTGQKNRIQVSQDTADLIITAGKTHWLSQREGLVTAKGKGEMQTFWLKPRRESASMQDIGVENPIISSSLSQEQPGRRFEKRKLTTNNKKAQSERWADLSLDDSSVHQSAPEVSTKKARLVNWNVDLLLTLLTKVVARRQSSGENKRWSLRNELTPKPEGPWMILDEVTEIINLPGFDPKSATSDSRTVVLGERVKRQLRDYITRIAAMYHDVPFHNFEHASHVTMSANKLLKRIIHPDDLDYRKEGEKKNERARAIARDLHFSTYGISSDPLTQFSIVFSALIHDVDHTGLPNAQLVLERAELAQKYQNKSVAEQNSVAIAMEMLMEPKYEDLRSCIYGIDSEKKRFRQLVVNAVMATDIMDKGQQSIRKNRWDRAFNEEVPELAVGSPTEDLDINRKATSVIEHIIQASDVAHTMQHWRIYCKWNERLFQEMTAAYKAGRAGKDPAQGWYEGEIWFFDNYIIPLAKKLKECGVFGVASDEYLTYALENRKEWEVKGRGVVRQMIENVERGPNHKQSSQSSFDNFFPGSSGSLMAGPNRIV